MAAPLQRLSKRFGCSFTKLPIFCYVSNSYATKRNRRTKAFSKDPRQNTQYPYLPGDPYHEDLILEFEEKVKKVKSSYRVGGARQQEMLPLKSPVKMVDNQHILKKDSKLITTFGHSYVKLQEYDLLLGRTMLKAKSSSSDTIMLEGSRLIHDAIRLGAKIKYLYFCNENVLKELPPDILGNAQIFKILYKDMKVWSDTTTPPGILGIFKKPKQGEVHSTHSYFLPLTVILDRIKDPGNVGTIIRTAAAVGCQQVLVLKGCADVWERKVLRSGMGSHFAVPVYNGLSWSQVYNYVDDNAKVFLADARKGDMGNLVVQIPDDSTSSSSSDSEGDSDEETLRAESDHGTNTAANVTNQSQSAAKNFSFPIISYSKMNFHFSSNVSNSDMSNITNKKNSVALVIGNETEGLSLSALKFARDYYGTFVTVPMNDAIDSLNTSIAGSIILFEIRRKLLEIDT